jgi:hypothetical protein
MMTRACESCSFAFGHSRKADCPRKGRDRASEQEREREREKDRNAEREKKRQLALRSHCSIALAARVYLSCTRSLVHLSWFFSLSPLPATLVSFTYGHLNLRLESNVEPLFRF